MAKKNSKSGINDQQKLFCQEYIIDLNGTQAAIRAGYSKRSARQLGSLMLTNNDIRAYIEALQKERSQRTEITSDFVLTGLKEVAERCLQKVPVMEWDYESRSLVQKKDENGNAIWEFDSSGANRAFELLGKHIGLFEKDNRQKSSVISVNVTDEE